MTLANQSVQAANQSRVLVANPHNAAQANTLFIVGVFMGGSTGAIVGPVAYSMGAMPAVAVATCVLVIAGLIAWAVACTQQKRRDRRRVACDQQVVACPS